MLVEVRETPCVSPATYLTQTNNQTHTLENHTRLRTFSEIINQAESQRPGGLNTMFSFCFCGWNGPVLLCFPSVITGTRNLPSISLTGILKAKQIHFRHASRTLVLKSCRFFWTMVECPLGFLRVGAREELGSDLKELMVKTPSLLTPKSLWFPLSITLRIFWWF